MIKYESYSWGSKAGRDPACSSSWSQCVDSNVLPCLLNPACQLLAKLYTTVLDSLSKGGDTLPAIHALTHSCLECGLQCCLQNFARNHCQNRLPALFDFCTQFMPQPVLLQTLRGEISHADVAAIASYQLFSSFRCNSAVYWNFTIAWDWNKYSQMYLNTKYLTKSNWIANKKWKSIEILNN